jgi:hypothetical protein
MTGTAADDQSDRRRPGGKIFKGEHKPPRLDDNSDVSFMLIDVTIFTWRTTARRPYMQPEADGKK